LIFDATERVRRFVFAIDPDALLVEFVEPAAR
jgi:hypothetical protein